MVEGKIILRTTTNAWERWKELRKKALVATVAVDEEKEEDWEIRVARTNFAQEWA